FHIGRLLMLLGITGHTVAEGYLWRVEAGTVVGDAVVEIVHLFLQACSIRVTVHASLLQIELFRVSSQQEQICDAQKGEVDQCILGLLFRESLRDNVWYCPDTISVLYGGSDRH